METHEFWPRLAFPLLAIWVLVIKADRCRTGDRRTYPENAAAPPERSACERGARTGAPISQAATRISMRLVCQAGRWQRRFRHRVVRLTRPEKRFRLYATSFYGRMAQSPFRRGVEEP